MLTSMSIRRRSILDPNFCVKFTFNGEEYWDTFTWLTPQEAKARAVAIWELYTILRPDAFNG